MGATAKNPYNNNYASVIATNGICAGILVIFVALRFHVRRMSVGKPRLDDWLLLAGALSFLICLGTDTAAWVQRARLGVVGGDPGHLFEIIDIMFFILAEVFVRGAYTAFYFHIVPTQLDVSRLSRWLLVSLYTVYATFQLTTAFIYLFQCGAPRVDNTGRKCISGDVLGDLFKGIFCFDCLFDWLMVLIPIRVIWSNTVSRSIRLGAIAVLLLGCCSGILAIYVICVSHQQEHYSTANGENLYLSIRVDILASCEIMVAIICLCLATFRPLFTKLFGNEQPKSLQTPPEWARTASGTSSDFIPRDYPTGRRESVANCLGLEKREAIVIVRASDAV